MTPALLALAIVPGVCAGDILTPKRVVTLQHEAVGPDARYDWGPSVMRDDDGLYRMWWVRLAGSGQEKRFPDSARLPGGGLLEFSYPDWGDRIFHAISRDGLSWRLEGPAWEGAAASFGPDAPGPLLALGPAENGAEVNHVGTPTVIRVGGTYYCYYEACADWLAKRDEAGNPVLVGEYHNQVFVATSEDGRTWRKYPSDADPQPIIAAPASNLDLGNQRYGLGQPTVYYADGRFVLHYVDSCTGSGDFLVRVESEDPFFRTRSLFARRLAPSAGEAGIPEGAVARFAQTDIKPLEGRNYLLRPAYGTGRIGILATSDGVFAADADASAPADVFPQIDCPDPRGGDWLERLYPRWLTDGSGQILIEDGQCVIYYSSGQGWKDLSNTWDVLRLEVPVEAIRAIE